MTPDQIDRAREQDRLRQARRRNRSAGTVMMALPPDVADELGDDAATATATALEILRRHLARTVRDIA